MEDKWLIHSPRCLEDVTMMGVNGWEIVGNALNGRAMGKVTCINDLYFFLSFKGCGHTLWVQRKGRVSVSLELERGRAKN